MMLNDLQWKGFERLVFAVQKLQHSNAIVEFDAKLVDINTMKYRQVDILIKFNNQIKTNIIAVECKHYKTKKVTQPDVEQFASFLKSIDAAAGVMVASSGFSSSAKLYADAMEIKLFSVEDATGFEWNQYILSVSEPRIYKRLLSGQIVIETDQGSVPVCGDLLKHGASDLVLYVRHKGEFVSVSEARKDKEILEIMDVDHELFMPTVLGTVMQCVEGSVVNKLESNKKIEFMPLRDKATKKDGSWTTNISHQFYDSTGLFNKNSDAPLSWTSFSSLQVIKESRSAGDEHWRFLKYNGAYRRIYNFQFVYRAEIGNCRYYKNRELSELDLSDGIVYIDVLGNKKSFFLASDLR